MYKEMLNHKPRVMYWAEKANSNSSYSITNTETFTQYDNMRTAGENTPLFHKKKREGQLLPFTSFLQLTNKHIKSGSDREIKRLSDGWQKRWYGEVCNHTDFECVSWNNASSVGDGKTSPDAIMQRAAAGTAGTWDVLTFAAEMGQTVSMFRNLLTKVIGILRAKPPGTPWNLWLEGRYGWRTLAFDMNDIEQAFSRQTKRRYSTSSAGQSISWVTNYSSTGSLNNICAQTIYERYEYQMNTRGRIVVVGQLPRFQINLLKTAWEVTKLSFVVDWFLTIGAWIDSLQFVIGEREYTAGLGSQIEVKYSAWANFAPNAGYVMLKTDYFSEKEALIQRRSPASVPLVPLFSLNLDKWKIVDLLSLLVQVLWRK